MFTGIVKAIGIVEAMRPQGGDFRLSITSHGPPWAELAAGDSIAVNGVCLTATAMRERGFEADVSAETVRVTTLGALKAGSEVNLEPAIRLDERLGGHLVSGHVDCIGRVLERKAQARSLAFRIGFPAAYGRYIAPKGSVCTDGVSLTVNEVDGEVFTVNIVPHTAQSTILGRWREGSKINIEVDIIARYLERLLSAEPGSKLSKETLQAHGYA